MKFKWTKKKKIWLGSLVGAFVVLALFIHVVLPPFLLKEVNSHMKTFSPVYAIHVGSLDISILRMAYRFNDMEAKFKKDGSTFFHIDSVDVSIAWRELFHGRVLTDVVANGGWFFLTKNLIEGSKTPEAKPKEDAKHVAKKLFPVRVARIELHESTFEFADLIGQPEVKRWRVSGLEGKILNINPTPNNPFTFFNLKGNMLDSAVLKLAGKAKSLEEPLAWKVDAEIHDFDLVAANPLLLKLVPLTFTAGRLDAFSEIRSQHGNLQGYVKPFFKKVHVLSAKEHYHGFKHFAIEIATALANVVLRDSQDKVVAAKIPFHREGDSLKIDKKDALATAVKNGFKEPLSPTIEDNLSLQ